MIRTVRTVVAILVFAATVLAIHSIASLAHADKRHAVCKATDTDLKCHKRIFKAMGAVKGSPTKERKVTPISPVYPAVAPTQDGGSK